KEQGEAVFSKKGTGRSSPCPLTYRRVRYKGIIIIVNDYSDLKDIENRKVQAFLPRANPFQKEYHKMPLSQNLGHKNGLPCSECRASISRKYKNSKAERTITLKTKRRLD
ncbi:MAG: hypothetical protein QW707_02565, partial [Candidatus Bathyarchaeia archaeon]